jgi:ABC-type Fe3+-siderophore transport system permease subunit
MLWPSGWVWHGGEGVYYLQMICGIYAVLGLYLIAAARNPSAYRSVISFTVWSSVVHAAIMAVQALGDAHEYGHLIGDVPALLIVAGVLWYLSPHGQDAAATA